MKYGRTTHYQYSKLHRRNTHASVNAYVRDNGTGGGYKRDKRRDRDVWSAVKRMKNKRKTTIKRASAPSSVRRRGKPRKKHTKRPSKRQRWKQLLSAVKKR